MAPLDSRERIVESFVKDMYNNKRSDLLDGLAIDTSEERTINRRGFTSAILAGKETLPGFTTRGAAASICRQDRRSVSASTAGGRPANPAACSAHCRQDRLWQLRVKGRRAAVS